MTIAVIGAAFVGAALLSFPSVAQQKTVKACTEEWQANKDANQAKGVTLKAYVTQCRGEARHRPKALRRQPRRKHSGCAGGDRPEDRQGLRRGMARQQGRQ